jgi:putative serine protease PepD
MVPMMVVEGERAAGPPIDGAATPHERAGIVASSSGEASPENATPGGPDTEPAPGPVDAAERDEHPPAPGPDGGPALPDPDGSESVAADGDDESAPGEADRSGSVAADGEHDEPAPAGPDEDRPVAAGPDRDDPPVPPAPAVPPQPRRRRGALVGAVLLALLLTIGGGVVGAWAALTFRPGPPPPPASAAVPAPTGLVAAVEAVAPAVVRIQAGEPETGTAGTALVVTPTGDVVTNAHLVLGETTATVIFPDGRSSPAQVVKVDEEADLAWLRIDGAQGLPVVRLAGPVAVRPGEDVVAIGNALNLDGPPSITRGIVSAVGRSTATLDDVIQTDAAISSGSSGGALVARDGTVVGITTEALVGDPTVSVEDVAFAIPADRVVAVLRGMGLVLPPG